MISCRPGNRTTRVTGWRNSRWIMGDISRHRDIFLNTQEAIPRALLDRCGIANELTYLELGNFLTDVSQFRDPVFYIFAKQRMWREEVLDGVAKNPWITGANLLLALGAMAAAAKLASSGKTKAKLAALPLAALPLQGILANRINDAIAGALGLDDWIDKLLGKPIERIVGDGRKRTDEEYGFVGQFFQYFMEGITHLLFAAEINEQVTGDWGKVNRIPQANVSAVFKEFFTV